MKKILYLLILFSLVAFTACNQKRKAAKTEGMPIVDTLEKVITPEVILESCYSADTLQPVPSLHVNVLKDQKVTGEIRLKTTENDTITGTFEGAKLSNIIKGIYNFTQNGMPKSTSIAIQLYPKKATILFPDMMIFGDNLKTYKTTCK